MLPLTPDPSQRRVLDHDEGTLLVTGGPGSGKTAMLVERFARLIEEGAGPERVVLVSLTRRGAHAARSRALRRLGRSVPELPAVTWHGFALRILAARREALQYGRPPRLLTAPEQYQRVAELLAGEDARLWPVLGRYLPLRRFARDVADFVLRAQERLVGPDELVERARAAGREDLTEVGAFYGRYADVLQLNDEVDFAGLLNQAVKALEEHGGGEADHVLVDDFQDVTPAAERMLAALERTARSVVVAADPDGHVFSFRGGSVEPLRRLAARPHVATVKLEGQHRLPPTVENLCHDLTAGRARGDGVAAWRFGQPAQEADAIARELVRAHLEDALPWGAMAVVMRRYGEYLPVLRRALAREGVPHLVLGEDAAIVAEPAVRPIVRLLRFAVRPERREELLEGLLVSPVVGLRPHEVRMLRRAAKAASPATTVLAVAETMPPDLPRHVRDRLAAMWTLVAEVEKRARSSSPSRVFFHVWQSLPHLRALVAAAETSPEANRNLDALTAFSDSLQRFEERRDQAGLRDYLDVLEEVEFGPDPLVPAEERAPDAVRILSVHRAHGEEFDLTFVMGCLEGEFPRLSAPRPLVSIEDLDGAAPRERFLRRFGEERALFRLAVSRGRRVVVTASEARDSRKPRTPTRFLPAGWGDPQPRAPVTLRQAEAEHRRVLADTGAPPAARLAALAALGAIPTSPDAWWGGREWTPGPPLHEGEIRTSYSRLSPFENCGLQYLYGTELGLDYVSGAAIWVGSVVHRVIEEAWKEEIPRTREAMERRLDELWRSDVFGSRAEEHRRRLDASVMLQNLEPHLDNAPDLVEQGFEYAVDGAVVRGKIDAVFRMPQGLRIVDYKTGRSAVALYDVEDNLQLGIYLLAVLCDERLRELGKPYKVELVYLGTSTKKADVRPFTPKPEHARQFEERLQEMLRRIREEEFAPSPEAECRTCSFKRICPLWAEGAEVALT